MTVESPLGTNRWHHGNGVLVCGTVRIATADFDTNPPQEFQTRMFDWICQTLNEEANKPTQGEFDFDYSIFDGGCSVQ